MILFDGQPNGLGLAEIIKWGNPWHGLVTNGVLTLPNSATTAWPQPSGGHTMVVDAGAPASTNGQEDTAAGREWRNYALLAGDNRQLYGRNLYGWLYVAPDGSRWLCSIALTSLSSTALAGNLTAKRFGEFGGSPETVVKPFSLTFAEAVGFGSPGLRFCDATRDGAAALFMILSTDTNFADVPVAAFELSLSGYSTSLAAVSTEYLTASQHAQIQAIDPMTLDPFNVGLPTQRTYYEKRFWCDAVGCYWRPIEHSESTSYYWSGFAYSTRRTLSVWYDEYGNKQLLRVTGINATRVGTIDDYTSGVGGPINFTVESGILTKVQTYYGYARQSIALELNGVEIAQVSHIWTQQTENVTTTVFSVESTSWPINDYSFLSWENITAGPTTVPSTTETSIGMFGASCTSMDHQWDYAINSCWMTTNYTTPYGTAVIGGQTYRFRLEQYDRHVFGWAKWLPADTDEHVDYVMTPEGAHLVNGDYTLSTYGPDNNGPHVTYQRMTHDVAHDMQYPCCWV